MKEALGDDMTTIDTETQSTLDWLEEEGDGDRTAEEYDTRMKEVEGQLMPLVQKAYQANMPTGAEGGMPGGMPGGPPDGPPPTGPPPNESSVEEVD